MNEKVTPVQRGDLIRADWLSQVADRVSEHDSIGPSTEIEQFRGGGFQGITKARGEILVLAEMIRHVVAPTHSAWGNTTFNPQDEAAFIVAGDREFGDFVKQGKLIKVVSWDLPLIQGQRYVFRYDENWQGWIPTSIRMTEVVRTLSTTPGANGYIDALIQYYDDENQIWLDGPSIWVVDANGNLPSASSGVRAFTATIGDGASTSYVLTHNLLSQDLNVTVRRNVSPFDLVIADVSFINTSQITVEFAVAPALNEYRVIIERPG